MAAVLSMNGTSAETCPCEPCKQARDTTAEKVAALVRVDKLRENGWKVDLPDGQHAIMRDPTTLTNGQRRTFKETGVAVGLLNNHIERAFASGNAQGVEQLVVRQAAMGANFDTLQVAMFVTTWSYPSSAPLSNDFASLDAIPGPSFDRLAAVAKDLMHAAFLDDEPTGMDVDSPFPGSSDSNTPS